MRFFPSSGKCQIFLSNKNPRPNLDTTKLYAYPVPAKHRPVGNLLVGIGVQTPAKNDAHGRWICRRRLADSPSAITAPWSALPFCHVGHTTCRPQDSAYWRLLKGVTGTAEGCRPTHPQAPFSPQARTTGGRPDSWRSCRDTQKPAAWGVRPDRSHGPHRDQLPRLRSLSEASEYFAACSLQRSEVTVPAQPRESPWWRDRWRW